MSLSGTEYRGTAEESEAGTRLDAFLASKLSDVSRSQIAGIIENSGVSVSGKHRPKSYKVQPGDEIVFTLPDPTPAEAAPQSIPLDVRFEDDDVIVVNKPRGMVVHPSAGHTEDTLVNALLYRCGESLSGIGGKLRPGIVHRIDRDTAGLVIAAKNDFAHRSLSAQLKDHSLRREYDAIACGNLRDETGTIEAPLSRHPNNRLRRAVVPGGKRAVTHYEVTERFRGYTRVSCKLETGRTHQIRAHFAYIGHPLLGDKLYGGGETSLKISRDTLAGQCLAAVKLVFAHPRTGMEIYVTCPPPDWFMSVIDRLHERD